MSNTLENYSKDPIGYVSEKITGDPNKATGPISDWKPTDFTSGGLSGSTKDGVFSLTRSNELQGAMGGLQSALSQRALEFANLRKGLNRDVKPLVGALRETGTQAIRDRGRRAIGDLRENLASRRVAGSSFAADALSRAEAEFGKEEAQFGAEVGMKEFEMNQQILEKDMALLDQETKANVESFNTQLTQLNLEGALAAQISTGLSGIAAENARAIGQIMAEYAAARTNILGTALGTAASVALVGGLSDRRLKKDIKKTGEIGPLSVYKFKYLWDDAEITGFMAQDVEEIFPEAVVNNGFKLIDYKVLRERLCH